MKGATQDEAGPLPWTVTPEDPELQWKNFLKNPSIPGELIALTQPPAAPLLKVPIASLALIFLAVAMLGTVVQKKREASKKIVVIAAACGIAAIALWSKAIVTVTNPLATVEIGEGGSVQGCGESATKHLSSV